MTLDLPLVARGKVREVYAVGEDRLLLVASDRISAYDVVLPTPIPDKGRVLTALSGWWFEQLTPVLEAHGAAHHLVSADDVPAEVAGRAMLVRRLEMLPVECVARGHLSGSGTHLYQRSGAIRDVVLPPGLVEGGLGRELAYALFQSAAMRTWQEGTPFRETLRDRAAAEGVALDEARLDEICRPEGYVQNLGPLFDRLAALS